jgi:hypothetical protein
MSDKCQCAKKYFTRNKNENLVVGQFENYLNHIAT